MKIKIHSGLGLRQAKPSRSSAPPASTINHGFGLWSASGRSEAQAERRRERSRSATPTPSRRRKPAAVAANTIAARDERAVLRRGTDVVERDTGRRAGRGAQQTARWSRRIKFLVGQALS